MIGYRSLLWAVAATLDAAVCVLGAWDSSTTAILTGLMGAVVLCVVGLWPSISTVGLKSEMARRELAIAEWKKLYAQAVSQLQAEREAALQQIQRERGEWGQDRDELENRVRAAEVLAMKYKTRWEIAIGRKDTGEIMVAPPPPTSASGSPPSPPSPGSS